jgi:hypothetical protein
MSMALLITILFVLAIFCFVYDFFQRRLAVSLGLAFLTGALLFIST